MSDVVAVPVSVADEIEARIRQQQEIGMVVQTIVSTAAQMLALPPGWQYDPARRGFVGPAQEQSEGGTE